MEQRTDEWFQARLGKVTASRISDVLAAPTTLTYANYQAQLISERLTGRMNDGFTNSAMQWGVEHEGEARTLYSFMTDIDVRETGFVTHPSIEMAGASPDGLIDEDGLLEIKCPNTTTHIKTAKSNHIEARYRRQMTWQMACTQRDWCDFVSYDPRLPAEYNLCIIRFERDEKEVRKLESAVSAFLDELEKSQAEFMERFNGRGVNDG